MRARSHYITLHSGKKFQDTMRSRMHYLRLSVALCGALCTASVGLAAGPDVSGVTNFHQVNEHVYRGAQPSENGFQNLAKIGIKTILDLRDEPDLIRAEKRVV